MCMQCYTKEKSSYNTPFQRRSQIAVTHLLTIITQFCTTRSDSEVRSQDDTTWKCSHINQCCFCLYLAHCEIILQFLSLSWRSFDFTHLEPLTSVSLICLFVLIYYSLFVRWNSWELLNASHTLLVNKTQVWCKFDIKKKVCRSVDQSMSSLHQNHDILKFHVMKNWTSGDTPVTLQSVWYFTE